MAKVISLAHKLFETKMINCFSKFKTELAKLNKSDPNYNSLSEQLKQQIASEAEEYKNHMINLYGDTYSCDCEVCNRLSKTNEAVSALWKK